MDARQIILEPIMTEKTTADREKHNQYAFRVSPRASKGQIARAVEEIFGVQVTRVRTINMAGKKKRLGRNLGRTASWKKALVTLAEGNSVDFFEGA
ncbi:50S ribosomal protein L23 [Candidatus Fermentibacterales bacterium]|nr:50S ribosomal protein L23 [Candidatus Fermentibacterales bacterium]